MSQEENGGRDDYGNHHQSNHEASADLTEGSPLHAGASQHTGAWPKGPSLPPQQCWWVGLQGGAWLLQSCPSFLSQKNVAFSVPLSWALFSKWRILWTQQSHGGSSVFLTSTSCPPGTPQGPTELLEWTALATPCPLSAHDTHAMVF